MFCRAPGHGDCPLGKTAPQRTILSKPPGDEKQRRDASFHQNQPDDRRKEIAYHVQKRKHSNRPERFPRDLREGYFAHHPSATRLPLPRRCERPEGSSSHLRLRPPKRLRSRSPTARLRRVGTTSRRSKSKKAEKQSPRRITKASPTRRPFPMCIRSRPPRETFSRSRPAAASSGPRQKS